ncbi:hypothetical protein [Antheraea proylei nucleopolyhedrovirus]|uniref:Uncharacterized protein n=2 Tax=Antheraea pernyi nuclear polyhedrosis virus TaxID=161494 RepID=A8C641_NPVAP|nr:unknown [Antheraea pernyi nucleopolyhedrovirus]AWD33589.1 hypothetical protein [Antheraea proylei nucleopolyhedrovirus]AYW35416.1 hypothetical protein [Antheraea proylei nucleopolyhedrovirus]BBD50830.1 hypothetical protein [Antheraea proylei nucleopolyhedrovirus]
MMHRALGFAHDTSCGCADAKGWAGGRINAAQGTQLPQITIMRVSLIVLIVLLWLANLKAAALHRRKR